MRKSRIPFWDEQALKNLKTKAQISGPNIPPGKWVRNIRSRLRITQKDLARRAGLDQPHLARIESGKIKPSLATLKSVFHAMHCGLAIVPQPEKPFDDILKDQARKIAVRRLRQSMGSMALEKQAPNEEAFNALVEKKTKEILSDKRINLWK